jgi:thiamine biosynthesis lipoprotein
VKDPQIQAKAYYEYFDTKSIIYSYKGDSEAEFKANCTVVESLLAEYHKLFDIYFEYSGINNIKTINKNAGKAPVEVDEKLIDFLLYCKEAYALTGGKTNVAMGAVLRLWHDCREDAEDDPENAKIPDMAELEAARLHCDINDLIIDEEAGTVYISDPDMSLDVGAIGKGYATECAAEMLIGRGVTSYVLNIGGNIRAIGEKVTGDGWVTGITNPNKLSEESFIAKVSIKNTSLVTSGDYERYYYADGVKYHHVIDPVTLMPAAYFSSVSIFTLDSGLADALSTALFCMSYEEGLALVKSIGGVEVIWVDPDYNVKCTSGIELLPLK